MGLPKTKLHKKDARRPKRRTTGRIELKKFTQLRQGPRVPRRTSGAPEDAAWPRRRPKKPSCTSLRCATDAKLHTPVATGALCTALSSTDSSSTLDQYLRLERTFGRPAQETIGFVAFGDPLYLLFQQLSAPGSPSAHTIHSITG